MRHAIKRILRENQGMELCSGWSKQPIVLSSTQRYHPGQILAKCKRRQGPFWLRVEDRMIPVVGESCLAFACQVSAAYHDWVAYNAPEDDGFAADMAERERMVQEHMEESESSDEGLKNGRE